MPREQDFVEDSEDEDERGESSEPQEEMARQFIDRVRVAPDIFSSTTTEGAEDERFNANLDPDDVEWRDRFHRSNSGGQASEPQIHNPDLPAFELTEASPGYSVYAKYLHSYRALIDKLIEDELQGPRPLYGSDNLHLLHECRDLLYPIDTRIVHSLIRGDLLIRYRNDPEIKSIMDRIWRSQSSPIGPKNQITAVQPSIYIQYLVDNHGKGLDAQQRNELIVHLRKYRKMNPISHVRWTTDANLG